MTLAISAEGLGKRYRIGELRRAETLAEQLTTVARRAARRLAGRRRREARSEIWALRDVSFAVREGEIAGVIGRNGAGKSTLLKLLSQITPPTTGQARLRGRVGSLLEVGTGFHPELTGRENIQLNGAILGMRRREIRAKFDAIVDFAGVERFIDTPVKRYSSGMQVRLAFAVAAHLEPEILLVDEVLAVGDAEFQRKCLGRMGTVAREGRTVLLVSHNMGAINQICPRTLWIDGGGLKADGPTAEIVAAYLRASDPTAAGASAVFDEDPGRPLQLRAVRLLDGEGTPTQRFSCDEPVLVELAYDVREEAAGVYGCFQITNAEGIPVLVSYSHDMERDPVERLAPGRQLMRITIPPRSLAAGDYRGSFSLGQGRKRTSVLDDCGTVCSFALDDLTTRKGNGRIGYLSTLLEWELEEVPSDVIR